MAIPANFFDQLGAELQVLRGLEAIWEFTKKVDGSAFFRDKLNTAYGNTIEREDVAETASKGDLTATIEEASRSNHTTRKTSFDDYFFAFMDDALNLSDLDIAGGGIDYVYDATLLAAGQPSITERRGRIGALKRAMVADAVTVEENVVAISAAFAGLSTNTGVLAASGELFEDHTLGGEFIFTCVDETVDAPKLTAVLELTNSLVDGRTRKTGENNISVGKQYEDGGLYLGITIDLGPVVETGDDGSMISAITVSNPSEADSAKGKHYIRVTRIVVGGGGPHFKIEWFRSGTLASTDLVATKDITGEVGTTPVQLVGSVTTIDFTFDIAAAVIQLPVATNTDDDIILDIKTPRLNEQWNMSVTNDEAGEFATKIARRYDASLNSAAAPTITDSKAASLVIQ